MSLQLLVNGISLGAVYAVIAVGFALIFNILKFSNFSHSGVLVSTAYIGYVVNKTLGTGFWSTIIITAILGGILALIIEFIGFRYLRKQNAQLMLYFVSSITIGNLLKGLVTVFYSGAFYSYPVFFKPSYFTVGDIFFVVTEVLMFVIAAISMIVLAFILKKTRLGVSIRALSMDAETTSLMGVNVTFIICATFFVSGMFGGMAGVFLAINYSLYSGLSEFIVKGFISSIIGGLGNITGAIIGAFSLGLFETIIKNVDGIGSSWAPVVVFMVMIAFLLIRPQGIAGSIIQEKV